MKTCFVVMPIGDIPGVITEGELKQRYTDLIREALQRAAPELEVTRADEVAAPGAINTDIITRIMHADLVLADITFPNPNVFYELGLRHAARAGTILIKEQDGKGPPFDVHGLRHIPYTNTASGLKQLGEALKKQITWMIQNPGKPDNSFLELAHYIKYAYPDTGSPSPDAVDAQTQLIMRIAANPKLAAKITGLQAKGSSLDVHQFSELIQEDPEVMKDVVAFMFQHGGQKLVKR